MVIFKALQYAFVPPLVPSHVQSHVMPASLTGDTVPVRQRLVVGGVAKVWPFALPQVPLTAGETGVTLLDVPPAPLPTELVAVTVNV
jgi:hypothetical protein